jgi:hypothetical protein
VQCRTCTNPNPTAPLTPLCACHSAPVFQTWWRDVVLHIPAMTWRRACRAPPTTLSLASLGVRRPASLPREPRPRWEAMCPRPPWLLWLAWRVACSLRGGLVSTQGFKDVVIARAREPRGEANRQRETTRRAQLNLSSGDRQERGRMPSFSWKAGDFPRPSLDACVSDVRHIMNTCLACRRSCFRTLLAAGEHLSLYTHLSVSRGRA